MIHLAVPAPDLAGPRGLLEELPIDGTAAVHASNTEPHHHRYDLDTGQVADLRAVRMQVLGVEDAVTLDWPA